MSILEKQDENFYRKTVDETIKILDSSESGLSSDDAKERLDIFGYNELQAKKPIPKWKRFLEQFNDFLIWILIGSAIFAAVVAVFENEPPTDTLVIVVILIINAILGFYQENQAEEAIEALKKMSASKARVVRDGKIVEIYARELVPGDVIVLETGDAVPADARLIESNELKVDEASLTGESRSVKKSVEKIDEEVTVGDMVNTVFSSTIVTYGRGKAIVTLTGMKTQVGKIAKIISETDDEMTPLAKKIDVFGKKLGILILLICAASFVVYILRYINNLTIDIIILSLMVAISLAVAAIPEGLPAIVTTSLALGVKRMAKKNAIVRKLPSVETLGCTTVICSDKTGTLTKNEMTILKVFLDFDYIDVTGSGYEPIGEFYQGGNKINHQIHDSLNLLGKVGVLCNNATLKKDDEKEQWVITGDPTEAAFLTLGAKLGITRENQTLVYRRISEVFFSSERKKMSTVDMNLKDEGFIISMKGALESVLESCTKIFENGIERPITEEDIKRLTDAQLSMSSKALRVLAIAYKKHAPGDIDLEPEAVESDLIFLGLVGMIDPPRSEAKDAVAKCKKAGISVIMITGDHAATAAAIAQELGILPVLEDESSDQHHIIEGKYIDNMKDEELLECDVFARVAPEHKLRIVSVLQEAGNVVSMTGDGVNDAPALKKADAGIAMGITGTDVSREAADIVLTDDNFASIVAAVEEGRAIYDNMKRFINFLISCNLGEILVIFIAAVLFMPTPLLAIHLLWVNLLTDGLPALAMGFEKPDQDLMLKQPRPPDEPIITKRNSLSYIISGIVIGFSCVFTFWFGLLEPHDIVVDSTTLNGNYYELYHRLIDLGKSTDFTLDILDKEILPYARTLAFSSLVVSEMMNAYNCRSETISIFKKKLSDNWFLFVSVLLTLGLNLFVIYVPAAATIFRIKAITLEDWIFVILLASPRIWSEEIIKLYWKKAHPLQ
ncbi:MAG: cation-translocating P-type ATPase [Promethearchaeota archaeon]